MDHTPFIFLSYVLTLSGVGGLLLASWRRLRRAERRLERLR
ncbi:MAG: heme exporter protein CcmD [Sphingomonadaceae bacterium]